MLTGFLVFITAILAVANDFNFSILCLYLLATRAFACQHLKKQSKTGFVESFESHPDMKLELDDDFQVWCDQCEQERLITNGWTDESMAFAGIKLICEKCYFDIKEFNLGQS